MFKKYLLMLAFAFATTSTAVISAAEFDHSHAQFNGLLKKHVQWIKRPNDAPGVATRVDYAGFKKDHAALKQYTASLAAVKSAQYQSWNKAQKRAFLINAYNAYTVELILTKYPNLKSIKDLGSLVSSPWSKRNYSLLGGKRSLDDIEHVMLRGAADFDEPRIHFAVNCASIGCPALRPEAFTADQLELQLEDQTRRFMQDRSRNRHDRKEGVLYLSKIFDWYRGDFEKGHLDAKTLEQFAARYAGSLEMTNAEKAQLIKADIDIEFLDYDWNLNK